MSNAATELSFTKRKQTAELEITIPDWKAVPSYEEFFRTFFYEEVAGGAIMYEKLPEPGNSVVLGVSRARCNMSMLETDLPRVIAEAVLLGADAVQIAFHQPSAIGWTKNDFDYYKMVREGLSYAGVFVRGAYLFSDRNYWDKATLLKWEANDTVPQRGRKKAKNEAVSLLEGVSLPEADRHKVEAFAEYLKGAEPDEARELLDDYKRQAAFRLAMVKAGLEAMAA